MDVTSAPSSARIVLGRYELQHRLGGGGFGVVWRAQDLKLDRPVAVKRIPTGDPDVAERARREGLAAARLSHPGIVALYETGADEDAVYLVSELVEGRTLADRAHDGELSDRDVLQIGITLCDALAHAHQRGVVHRDVKPANVLLPDPSYGGPSLRGRTGETTFSAKLTDFGIARLQGDDALTRTGDVVGTLAYMAPEQAEGRGVGPEADLYALGLCLYEALAGVNPVRARGATATVRRIGRRLPPLGRLRRDLPLDLCDAIDAAVRPRPEERGTLKRLRAALSAARTDVGDEPGTIEGSPLEPIAPVHPPLRTPLPDRALATAGTVALAGGVLAAGPSPPVPAWQVLAAAAVLALLLPRVGWLLTVTVLCWWLLADAPVAGGLLAAAAIPVAVVLRHAPASLWSLPAAAPVLGLAGVAGAFPALAAAAPRAGQRAAVGALGAWALLLAEALVTDPLLLGGGAPGGPAPDVVWWALSSGVLVLAVVWGLAAAVAPVLIRGRRLALDVVAAVAWAAALAGATHALADALVLRPPDGLAAGAAACAAASLAVRRLASRPRG
ncbi:MAG TPA: serine/threonine-protein kinase [Baekduia sp.]|nr:serine/threonine-protein kinase [Baekduia sp.]